MLKFNLTPRITILIFKPRTLSSTIKSELLTSIEDKDIFNLEQAIASINESPLRGSTANYSHNDIQFYTSITAFNISVKGKTFTLPENFTKDSLRSFSLTSLSKDRYTTTDTTVENIYAIKVRNLETYTRLEVLSKNTYLLANVSRIELFLRDVRGILLAPERAQVPSL